MMKQHSLQFVASMTVCPSDIVKIRRQLEIAKPKVKTLASVLITPLFANIVSLSKAKQMSEEGSKIFFDSGGYYVQIGRIKYEELYMPLLEVYKNNRWADVYTLPDHVPTSQDSPEMVDKKIANTITYSTLFFQELPDELKPRAMPVVQGHTLSQVERCLHAYINLGVKRVGFGSFGTAGQKSEINIATDRAVELAKHVIKVAHANGLKVHIFGIGAPALVAMLKGIEADSFDSSSWLKAAGFGQIFLPFMRAYNISHNSMISELQRGITFTQFREWRELTGHDCKLCESVFDLQEHKMNRAVHNLIAIEETVEIVNSNDHGLIKQIYESGSPRYRKEYEKWLQPI
jgi:hypothetical protein